MTNKPKEITKDEWAELLSNADFIETFLIDDSFENREEFIDWVWGVKFDYMEDCPGYAGDLFLFMGGVLDVRCPVIVYRDKTAGLKVLRAWD